MDRLHDAIGCSQSDFPSLDFDSPYFIASVIFYILWLGGEKPLRFLLVLFYFVLFA